MPTCYATILKTKDFIIARTEMAIYKLGPKDDPYIAREKKVDTGHNWATCNAQAGTTDKPEDVKRSLTATFAKFNLRTVDFRALLDKETGVFKNQYRIAFEILDGFDKLGVYKIKNSTLPSGAGIMIKLSPDFHKLHALHLGCSKTTDNRAPISVRCSCNATRAGPSTSMANRAAAHASFKERALKRARDADQTDPFA
jgi:hypothetical protein